MGDNMTTLSERNWYDENISGILQQLIGEHYDMPVADQIARNYAHGGGFNPFDGFQLNNYEESGKAHLAYPDDPPMKEMARHQVRDELVILFDYSWVAVVQPDGEFKVVRMD